MRYALTMALVLSGSMACKQAERSEERTDRPATQRSETQPSEPQPSETQPSDTQQPSSAARATTAPTRGERRPGMRPESELTKPVLVDMARVQWMEGPPGLPKGSKFSVLEGAPPFPAGKTFTILLKFPKNYVIEPHTHLVTERVTVLDGALSVGHGTTLNRATATKVTRGGLILIPKDHVHYAFTADQETTLALTGVGPWEIIYVDPKNDPRPTPAKKPATPVPDDWDAKIDMKIIQSSDVQFADPPAELRMPEGVKLAVLEGNPADAKTFVVRLQLPPNTKLPPHSHAYSQRFMVLSGGAKFSVGEMPLQQMKAPSVMLVPKEAPHVMQVDPSGAVVQIVGVGPFDVTWHTPETATPRR